MINEVEKNQKSRTLHSHTYPSRNRPVQHPLKSKSKKCCSKKVVKSSIIFLIFLVRFFVPDFIHQVLFSHPNTKGSLGRRQAAAQLAGRHVAHFASLAPVPMVVCSAWLTVMHSGTARVAASTRSQSHRRTCCPRYQTVACHGGSIWNWAPTSQTQCLHARTDRVGVGLLN